MDCQLGQDKLACVASVSVGLGSKERQKRDFWCFALAKNGARAKKRKEGEGSRPIFHAGKTPKIPFLGLSLLPNPTETLAMQAKISSH